MKRFGIYAMLAAAGTVLLPWAVAEQSAPPAAADARQRDIAAIQALYSAWNEAVENGDIPGYLAALDADAELLPAAAPPIRGSRHLWRITATGFQERPL